MSRCTCGAFLNLQGQAAGEAMPADGDVEHLDVVEYVRVSLVPGRVDSSFYTLLLQRIKHALSNRCWVLDFQHPLLGMAE